METAEVQVAAQTLQDLTQLEGCSINKLHNGIIMLLFQI